MGCYLIILLAIVFALFLKLLPALIIFMVLDRYRPGAYTPQKRMLRMILYFVLIYAVQSLVLHTHLPTLTPWLLRTLLTWGLPFPVYYFVQLLFSNSRR